MHQILYLFEWALILKDEHHNHNPSSQDHSVRIYINYWRVQGFLLLPQKYDWNLIFFLGEYTLHICIHIFIFTFVCDPDDTLFFLTSTLSNASFKSTGSRHGNPKIECEFSHANLVECVNCWNKSGQMIILIHPDQFPLHTLMRS